VITGATLTSIGKRSGWAFRECHPTTVEGVHLRFRRRLSLFAAALCVVALTSCARTDDSPPTKAVQPEFTTSSDDAKPIKRVACSLLTAEERKALAGKSMNVVVPVSEAVGTHECQWVHSLHEESTSIIRVVAFNTREWASRAAPQIAEAMRNPKLSALMVSKLQDAARKLAEGPDHLTTEETCDIYWTLARSSGFRRGSQVVFSSMIGRLRTAYNTGCGDGVLTLIGYGELGLHTSLALYTALIDLRQTVHERAAEKLADEKPDDSPSAKPTSQPTSKPTPRATTTAGSSTSGSDR
jgi:hypothetical protein